MTVFISFEFLHREHSQFESQRHTYIKALEDAQREKNHLEKKIQVETLKAEAEKKKALLAQEALEEKVWIFLVKMKAAVNFSDNQVFLRFALGNHKYMYDIP